MEPGSVGAAAVSASLSSVFLSSYLTQMLRNTAMAPNLANYLDECFVLGAQARLGEKRERVRIGPGLPSRSGSARRLGNSHYLPPRLTKLFSSPLLRHPP